MATKTGVREAWLPLFVNTCLNRFFFYTLDMTLSISEHIFETILKQNMNIS